MVERYSYNIYDGYLVDCMQGYVAHVVDNTTGERVWKSVDYDSEEDAVNAALDWIDNAIAEGDGS